MFVKTFVCLFDVDVLIQDVNDSSKDVPIKGKLLLLLLMMLMLVLQNQN